MFTGLISVALGVLNWFSSAAFQSLTAGVVNVLDKRSDTELAKFQAAVGADKETTLARISADSTAYHERVESLKGFGLLQFLVFCAAAPAIYHQGMVYLDTCPYLPILNGWWLPTIAAHVVGSWNVPPPPGLYADHEWLIISSLLGISTIAVGAKQWSRR